MEEEVKENQEEVKEEKNNEIETVINLKKENDELKENFDKLQKEYTKDKKNYFEKLINNGTLSDEKKFSNNDIKNMVDDIYKGDLSNLEFWQKALNLSEAWESVYHKNIFNKSGDIKDETAANHVKDIIRKMVEEANGSPEAFRILYDSNVNDSNPKAKKTLL